jgi:hypothetical protein
MHTLLSLLSRVKCLFPLTSYVSGETRAVHAFEIIFLQCYVLPKSRSTKVRFYQSQDLLKSCLLQNGVLPNCNLLKSGSTKVMFYQSHDLTKSVFTKVRSFKRQVILKSGSTKVRFYQSQVLPNLQSQVLSTSSLL